MVVWSKKRGLKFTIVMKTCKSTLIDKRIAIKHSAFNIHAFNCYLFKSSPSISSQILFALLIIPHKRVWCQWIDAILKELISIKGDLRPIMASEQLEYRSSVIWTTLFGDFVAPLLTLYSTSHNYKSTLDNIFAWCHNDVNSNRQENKSKRTNVFASIYLDTQLSCLPNRVVLWLFNVTVASFAILVDIWNGSNFHQRWLTFLIHFKCCLL